MKHALKLLITTAVMVTSTAGLAGQASATTVPPGGSGRTCSGYDHVTPTLYWQTCAWADNNEVYFTVNLGNSGDVNWRVDIVSVDYIRSGTFVVCRDGLWTSGDPDAIVVRAHSVKSTPTATCAIPRRTAAYASVGRVIEGSYDVEMHSPTLQVQ